MESEELLAVSITKTRSGNSIMYPEPLPIRVIPSPRSHAWAQFTTLAGNPLEGWIHLPSQQAFLGANKPTTPSQQNWPSGHVAPYTKLLATHLWARVQGSLRTPPSLDTLAGLLRVLGQPVPSLTHPDAPKDEP